MQQNYKNFNYEKTLTYIKQIIKWIKLIQNIKSFKVSQWY